MARRRSPILLLIFATLVVVAAWYVVTPRRAWKEFLRAVAQNDQKALVEVVDYPAVREHANADLVVALANQPNARPGIPVALRGDIMENMVETMTSPQGLLQMVSSFSTPSGNGEAVRTSFHYRGLSRVDVLLGGTGSADTGAGLFTFERTGTHWRLTRASSQRIAALTPGS